MNIVLKVLGILIILDGIIIMIKPALVKTVMSFFARHLYLGAVIKGFFGLLFLFSVSDKCHFPAVIMIIGILGLFGAVVIVAFNEKMKSMMNFLVNRREIFWRLMSIVYLAFGALIIYSA